MSNQKRMPGLAWLALTLIMGASGAHATLRCGTGLVAEGDLMADITARCGAPIASASEGPALQPNGMPRLNAARISVWVYGPNGGGYQYLRFVDERLVEIELRRRPPNGPLLPW
ncbi:DUF2845 domain-containing protein [Pseudomonas sp. RIT-PI-S]|uniref:DUF2845 domain-containing protein n=1 Tax=Pseudomonas sp. RIT-PI-S TaxID=3035295 RepID=UPI0021DA0D87|nr:DUF2845 domain-containing protein [Pseudomonas sp. RIT-PI-S]